MLQWGGYLFTLDACTECYEQELQLNKQCRTNVLCEVVDKLIVCVRLLSWLLSLLFGIDRSFSASVLRGRGDLFLCIGHRICSCGCNSLLRELGEVLIVFHRESRQGICVCVTRRH